MPVQPYLNQIVTKKITASYDVYGTPVPATPQQIKCRIQSSSKRLIGQGGTEFTADAEIWLKPTEPLDIDDVVTWDGEDYKIVKMDTKRGLTGATNHKKGYLVVNRQS